MDNGVTIGIPVYNEAESIERAIRCAAPQCRKLIVADNASTDATEAVCLRLRGEVPNLEYIRHRENIGALNNWYFLLDKFDTPYAMILGSHDYLDDQYIQTLLDEFSKENDLVAAFGQLTCEYEDRTEESAPLNSWRGGMDESPLNRTWNALFDRVHVVWAAYGLFKTVPFRRCFTRDLPSYGPDMIFMARILAMGRLKIVAGTRYHAWMRDTKKTPSDYMERMLGNTRKNADKQRMRNEFRIAQYNLIMGFFPSASLLQTVKLRLLCMARFGVFHGPGIDPLFFALYLPAKLLRRFDRLLRFANPL